MVYREKQIYLYDSEDIKYALPQCQGVWVPTEKVASKTIPTLDK